MIYKNTASFFVLSIVGCWGFSIIKINDSKSFVELQLEAEETCITNYSLYSKESRILLYTSPSELVCPLHCFFSKLGVVNEGGLNKILINWIRKVFELDKKESIFDDSLQGLSMFQNQDSEGIRTRLDNIFNLIRTINDQLVKACSATDKATRNQLVMACLTQLQTIFHSQSPENHSIYVPSEEESRILELAQTAGQKCMSNFNVTLSTIIRDVKSANANKQNICALHCLYSELQIIDETGLNQMLLDDYRKIYKAQERLNELEVVLESANEILPILNSYCSSDNDILANDFEKIKKIWMDIKKLRSGSERE